MPCKMIEYVKTGFSVLAAVEKPQVVRISASKWLSPAFLRSELNLNLCHEWSRFLHWTFWCIAATQTQNIPAKALSYHSIMKRASASICWCHKRDASKAYDTADDASNLSKSRYSISEFQHKKHSVVSPTDTYKYLQYLWNSFQLPWGISGSEQNLGLKESSARV